MSLSVQSLRLSVLAMIASLAATALSSSAHADPLLKREFSTQIAFHSSEGSIKKLPRVRLKLVYSPSLLGNCQVEVGKEDAASLWTPTDSYDCKVVRNSVVVSNEVIGAIAIRSGQFPLVSEKVFEEIQQLVENGEVRRADDESAVGGVLRDAGIQSISLDETTRLTLTASRSQPQMSFSISPKAE